MLKQLKNFVLHDVTEEHEEFVNSPGAYIKKALLDAPLDPFEYRDPKLVIVDDGHPHGLGNPEILRSIFRYLTVPDLICIRSVNLRWNAIACELLRRKGGYKIIRPSQMKSFTKLMKRNITNPICSYAIRIDDMKALNVRDFLNRFKLEIVNLRVRLNIQEMLEFARFLQTMTNLMCLHIIIFDEALRLDLRLAFENGYEHAHGLNEVTAWKLGLYSFKKVHSLTFENSNPSYNINPYYDKIITNILNASSNLQHIKFQHWNSPLGNLFRRLGISKPGVVDTYGKPVSAEDLTTLFFSANLKFNIIRLQVNQQVPFELISDIIHKSGENLYDLNVINENIFERFDVSSVLRNLVKLRLNSWQGPVEFSYMARQFPALRILSLNLPNVYELENIRVAGVIEPCVTVRTLLLTRLETGIDAGTLERLADLFPAVKELFIEVRDGTVLQRIYELYSDLTLLCVELNRGEDHCYSMSNQCFTGVPDEHVRVLKQMDCGCPLVEFPEEARDCWNISCLKNLTTLLLRVPNSVDNIALQEGMSRLDRLENLVLLPFYYSDQVPTKWCLRTIADNFPRLKTLITSTEIEYTECDVQYLFKRLPKLIHRRKF